MENNSGIEKSDALTVVLHWTLFITLIFSLLTGLRISADAPEPTWAQTISAILLQGNVVLWHVWAAFVLFFASVAYVIYLFRARLQSRVAIDSTRIHSLQGSDREAKWKSINILIYWLSFLLIFVAAGTGLLLYFFPALLPHQFVISIHSFVAWAIIAYVVIHITTQLLYGGWRKLLKILNPKMNYASAATTALITAALIGGGVYAVDKMAIKTIAVAKTDTPPILDGVVDDAVWQQAEQVQIPTNRGVNNPGGEVTVSVRMAHDDTYLYALFEWPDSTRSQKHLPLQKTADGWKVMQHEYHIQDEDHYYEDKFAVMFGHSPSIAGAGTSHYGAKPIPGKPGPAGGRGLHYTTDGSIVDVWHWKSVRTGSPAMNQIDDNYFGPPMEVNPKKKRYTGGYTQDPNTGGGYKMNWEKFAVDNVRPLRLPKDPSILARMGDVDLDPTVTDVGEYWMDMDMTIEYSEELDTYPIGTVIPSVLIKGPREGDRGDVQAYSQWKDGWWHMEVARKLDTGSKYDLAFNNDDPLYMWVAVFDHTQTRHSQHLHPITIAME